MNSHRVLDLNEGYKLWEIYVNKALAEEKAMHIKYEDLLAEPKLYLKDIGNYLGFNLDDVTLEHFSKFFDSNRKYAFLKDKTLMNFYKSIQDDEIMKKLAYDNIIE